MRVAVLFIGCFVLLSSLGRAQRATTDALLTAITENNHKKLGELLGIKNVDPNQPSSKGKLPIVEATKYLNYDAVDLLIQYGAFANAKEPATGLSALHVANEKGSDQIARLLIKYGADPNQKDKRGKAAREFAPTVSIRDLIAQYDNGGHAAFEDAPGDWHKAKNDKGEGYFFNIRTQESRWSPPPSCAWQRVVAQGQPIDYINSITSQQVHTTPQALAWRRVSLEGEAFWYNWRTNFSQHEVPAELPEELLHELEKQPNLRWHNTETGELTWEDPHRHTPWREVTDKESGDTYWFNVLTGESNWEKPAHLAWEEHEEEGEKFYHNPQTGESKWETPHHMAWEQHNSEL